MAVFKSSRKSDGFVEPAGRTPEPAHGGHISPCPCLNFINNNYRSAVFLQHLAMLQISGNVAD